MSKESLNKHFILTHAAHIYYFLIAFFLILVSKRLNIPPMIKRKW